MTNTKTNWAANLGQVLAGAAFDTVDAGRVQADADALAKLRAHVRTGGYNGYITRTIRSLQRKLPRAVVLCGGEATSKDHVRTSAEQIIRTAAEPFLSDMCPACRALVEGAGTRDLSHLRGAATGAQISYLRRLLIAAFAARFASSYDHHHLERISKRDASAEIDRLKAAQARGWK